MTHGWRPESGFLNYRWEGYDEALLLYVLGLGSPTHPLPGASYAFAPELVLFALHHCIHQAKLTEYNSYGFKASFNPSHPGEAGNPYGWWVSPWHYAINQGPIILMIENYRSRLLWKDGEFYDEAIRRRSLAGKSDEALFFELATEDLVQAADLFRPIHDATGGVDGWVSLEVSPLLAEDTADSIKATAKLHARATPQSLHQDPGDSRRHSGDRGIDLRGRAGECDALFSREHYIAAAEAYMRGVERRIAARLKGGPLDN